MAFDPATLLSRTTAGDSELSTPTSGLSLGQRKLLTYLDQPHALEELAAEHALEPVKLDRDLVKLASLNLIAIDGQDTRAVADSVVLGGWRAASMLRWLLPPLLLVGAGLLYFGLSAPVARKPEAPPLKLSATPSAVSAPTAAGPEPIANAGTAPTTIAPVPSPAAPADASPASRREAAPVAVDGARDTGRRDTKAVAVPEPVKPAMSASIAKPATIADASPPVPAAEAAKPLVKAEPIAPSPPPAPVARTEPKAAHAAAPAEIAAPSPTPAKSPTIAAGATTTTAGATTTSASAATATGAAAAAAPAAKPAAPAKTAAAAPDKLAMAAPSSADAHPRAAPKLLPIAHDEPEFPREALSRGVSSGTVKARLAIDAGGKVTTVAIVDSRPGHVFDRAVTQALSRWTFPAGDAGRSTEVEINFKRD